MEASGKFAGKPVPFVQKVRPLHWVIKVSNLKKALEMLTLLGARVLRHEEFESGCEATCNGPYSGYWSKSMVGWLNEDVSFVFELTFNYGVTNYKRGNDLNTILLYKKNKKGEDMEKKLIDGFEGAKDAKGKDGIYRLINDDFLFKFVDGKPKNEQLIKGLVLNCTNLKETAAYYKKIGLTAIDEAKGLLKYDTYNYFQLGLNQVDKIDRGEAFGRLAVSCADEDVQKVFEQSGSKIQNKPVTLPTEGKADVVVTILQSPDDQELCYVNETGFKDLSKETGEQVDWERYDKLNSV